MSKCPVCRKEVAPRRANPVFPFCSPRCQAVDLGKWLGEEYRVPGAPADGWPEEPPSPGGLDAPDGGDEPGRS